MEYFQFSDLVSMDGILKVNTGITNIAKEEMKQCSFCSLSILKLDMKKHTQFHILQWEGEEMLKEEQDEEGSVEKISDMMDCDDVKTENGSKDVESTKEISDEDDVKCSFCSKFIHKPDVKEHIHQHVLEWGAEEDKDDAKETHRNERRRVKCSF